MGKQFSAIHFRGQNVPNVYTSETLSSAKFPPHLCLFLALHLVATSALCSLNANLHSFSVSSVTSNGRTDIPEEHRQEADQRRKNKHTGMWQWELSPGFFFYLLPNSNMECKPLKNTMLCSAQRAAIFKIYSSGESTCRPGKKNQCQKLDYLHFLFAAAKLLCCLVPQIAVFLVKSPHDHSSSSQMNRNK